MKIFVIALLTAALVTVTGCGGGSSTPVPTPTPTPITGGANVTPTSASVAIGGTQQFTAHNFSGTVTWTLNPSVGTIDSTGLYHAPASFPSPNNLTVTATSGSTNANASALVVYPNDNASAESAPIKLGTSGANVNDVGAKVCCIGTLGSLWTRGTGTFILSNNHVLARSDQGTAGEAIQQPGQAACFASDINVANLTQKAALAPAGTTQGRTGAAPSNVDAAIAQVVTGMVDPTGSILDLGAAGPTSIAAAPPSATVAAPVVGAGVAKSGRTTGLTCSSITSINTSVIIAYETSCGSNVTAFNATYTGQVVINGGSFSAGGDSGSLVVTTAAARPVALLYGGSSTDTVANPLLDASPTSPGVITAFTNASGTPAPVGGADHAVSCQPTSAAGAKVGGAASATVPVSAPISSTERQRVTAVQMGHTIELMKDSAISAVGVGASSDSPGEGALVVRASRSLSTPIPPVIDGVRTRVVFEEGSGVQPQAGQLQIDRTTEVKELHEQELMGQPGIQGIGVTMSTDNPAETAISIYVVRGEAHPPIPAAIDGVRTRIFEGERFKAF